MSGVDLTVSYLHRLLLHRLTLVPLIFGLCAIHFTHLSCSMSQVVFELACVHFAIHVDHFAFPIHHVICVPAPMQIVIVVHGTSLALFLALFELSTIDCHRPCSQPCVLFFDHTQAETLLNAILPVAIVERAFVVKDLQPETFRYLLDTVNLTCVNHRTADDLVLDEALAEDPVFGLCEAIDF